MPTSSYGKHTPSPASETPQMPPLKQLASSAPGRSPQTNEGEGGVYCMAAGGFLPSLLDGVGSLRMMLVPRAFTPGGAFNTGEHYYNCSVAHPSPGYVTLCSHVIWCLLGICLLRVCILGRSALDHFRKISFVPDHDSVFVGNMILTCIS